MEMVCEDVSCLGACLTSTFEGMDVDEPVADDVDLANAVNLSESEDEVEEERISEDFFTAPDTDVRVRAFPSDRSLRFGLLGLRHASGESLLLPIPTKLP